MFNDRTRGKQLEVVQRDLLLPLEVPLDQVVEFGVLEFETTPFDQVSELVRSHNLTLLVLDSVEETLEEHVVLLFVGELLLALGFEGAHKLAELLLVDAAVAAGVAVQVVDERVVEALLGLLVVLVVNRPFEQVLHKGGHARYWQVVVRSEVEQQRAENVLVGHAILQKRVVVRVRAAAVHLCSVCSS